MKFPNKLFSYEESTISKFPIILNKVYDANDISIFQLYHDTFKAFNDISEFLDALDCLYALNKIDYNADIGRVHYVM